MLVMWEEKVDRDCSMLCSSPMSANTSPKHGHLGALDAPGMCRPAWAISVNRPTVLSVTVLPPVLGPVTTSVVKSVAQPQVDGHHLVRVDEGMAARTGCGCSPPVLSLGRTALMLPGQLRPGEDAVQLGQE